MTPDRNLLREAANAIGEKIVELAADDLRPNYIEIGRRIADAARKDGNAAGMALSLGALAHQLFDAPRAVEFVVGVPGQRDIDGYAKTMTRKIVTLAPERVFGCLLGFALELAESASATEPTRKDRPIGFTPSRH